MVGNGISEPSILKHFPRFFSVDVEPCTAEDKRLHRTSINWVQPSDGRGNSSGWSPTGDVNNGSQLEVQQVDKSRCFFDGAITTTIYCETKVGYVESL